jgi:hypothetical protein
MLTHFLPLPAQVRRKLPNHASSAYNAGSWYCPRTAYGVDRMIFRFLAALLLICTLTACSKLTLENYNKLETGMPYTQVVTILGSPTTCDVVLGIKNCVWGNDQKKITISFVGDKVIITTAENIH